MNSGIYIRNIFDELCESDLKNFVRNFDEKKLILKEQFKAIPQRATEFSAGYDLSVLNDETIPAHESRLISFGHCIIIDNPAVTAVVVPRSSLAKKRGLIIAGGPQYIYSGSGEGCLTLKFINYSDVPVELKSGDKIAQVIFIKYPNWITGAIESLSDEMEINEVLPDPLDETFMSPLFKDNLESIFKWKGLGTDYTIDQTDMVSYYFQSPIDVVLMPGKVQCIMTGIRCKVGKDQVFIIQNAFNNPCVELANSIGVIDADYYDNPDNGGEIGVLLLNRGNLPVKVSAGDVIASGSIYFYEKVDGDIYGGKRTGGFGSTGN